MQTEEDCTCKEYAEKFSGAEHHDTVSISSLFGSSSKSCSLMSLDEDLCRPFPDCHDLDKVILNQSIKKVVAMHERKRLDGFLEMEYEDKSLYIFMLEHGVMPFEIVMGRETKIDSIYDTVKEHLGPRNDYLISDIKREEELQRYDEIKCRAREQKEAKIQAEIDAKRLAREKQLEEEFALVTALKRKELTEIEACSLPLRNYLLKFIVPKLTEALVEVARVRPQDPIDFLAEHLFRNNTEGHMFDPCLSDRMAKKILNERMLEIGDGEEGSSLYCQCLYEGSSDEKEKNDSTE